MQILLVLFALLGVSLGAKVDERDCEGARLPWPERSDAR